jgi:hypothetical protein
VQDIIARALQADGDQARRELGILEYIGQESLFRPEDRIRATGEAYRMAWAWRRAQDNTAPNGWTEESYARALAELAARLELAEGLLGAAERITDRAMPTSASCSTTGRSRMSAGRYRPRPARRPGPPGIRRRPPASRSRSGK